MVYGPNGQNSYLSCQVSNKARKNNKSLHSKYCYNIIAVLTYLSSLNPEDKNHEPKRCHYEFKKKLCAGVEVSVTNRNTIYT